MTKANVALTAEEPANLSGGVIMIHTGNLNPVAASVLREFFTTNPAPSALLCIHRRIVPILKPIVALYCPFPNSSRVMLRRSIRKRAGTTKAIEAYFIFRLHFLTRNTVRQ